MRFKFCSWRAVAPAAAGQGYSVAMMGRVLWVMLLMVTTQCLASLPYHSSIIHPQAMDMVRDFDLCEEVSTWYYYC